MMTSWHDLTFGSPFWLWTLLTLPPLIGLFFWSEKRADRRLRQLIRAPRLRAQLTGAASTGRRRWRYGLMLLGLAGLIVSMAEPRVGYEQQAVHRQGLDLILIIDVSKSMLATDVLPNRLTRAKLAVQDGVRLLTGDRVGMVAFAGNAFLQAPLTIDYDAILNATNELDTDLIPRGGTNIGGGIELALDAFGKAEANNRAIILMSDGEPTSDDEQADGIKAAQAAAAAGVKIFTVGFGTTEGSLIPLGEKTGEFVREEDGSLVRSKLNEGNLTELAKATGGFYTPFTNGEATMRAVIQDGLGRIKTGEISAHENRKPIERYQWPLGAALIFLAASALIGERRKIPALAGVGGVSPGARAVPVPRRTPGGLAPAVPTVSAAVVVLILCSLFADKAGAQDSSPALPNSPSRDALDLYKNGKYDEAYKAFKQLAEKDPKAGNLQFDAGTSAYKSKQYDDAIQSFGNALASDDPGLQAQSQYNFGNTLFRHGEEQKSHDTKISDWKDAIKHYNDALNYLKTHKDEALAENTTYNRDVVQKHLDEEMKEKEKEKQQQQQKQDQKKDQKQDQQQKQDKNQQQSKSDQQKGDQKQQDQQQQGQQQQQQQGQQNQQQQQGGGGQSQGGSSGSGSENKSDSQQQQNDSKGEGKNNPTPQPDQDGQDGQDGQKQQSGQKPDAKQNPTPQPNQSKGDNGQSQDSQPPSDHPTSDPSTDGDKPDPSSVPNQDKPRERGDFKAQPSKGDKQDQNKDNEGKENDELARVEPGKMTPGQARALLDSLKGEDDRVNLVDRNHRNREETVTKDW